MKESNQKLLLSFVVGAAAGAAVSSFLHSDTGKETVAKVKHDLNDLEKEFTARMNRHVEEMQQSMSELVQDTGDKFEAATQQATQRMSELKSEAKEALQEGKEQSKPNTAKSTRSKS